MSRPASELFAPHSSALKQEQYLISEEVGVYTELFGLAPKGLLFNECCSLSDFPSSSAGGESTCNAGDPGSVPGSGRSTGEGRGCLLQYSSSLVAQLVKNPPTMRETWVQSLRWEDPLEEGKATHSRILAWRIPWTV